MAAGGRARCRSAAPPRRRARASSPWRGGELATAVLADAQAATAPPAAAPPSADAPAPAASPPPPTGPTAALAVTAAQPDGVTRPRDAVTPSPAPSHRRPPPSHRRPPRHTVARHRHTVAGRRHTVARHRHTVARRSPGAVARRAGGRAPFPAVSRWHRAAGGRGDSARWPGAGGDGHEGGGGGARRCRGLEPLLPLRLLAEVGGARFFSRLATTAEVGLTLRHEGWAILEPGVALAGSLGGVTRKGRAASAASLSVAPLVGVHRRLGAATARAATGPRLAFGRLRASAALPGDEARTFAAPWVAWLAQVGLAAPLGARFVVEVAARAGYVLSPIGGRIAGERAIAVEGAWVGGSLAVGALL